MAILVCGGAGYIGSHTVAALIERERHVVVVDNLQKGHAKAVHPGATLFKGDLRDSDFLSSVFSSHNIEAVIDFAADSLVGESVAAPLTYYHNNLYGTICLLETMRTHGVRNIVFSSTAAVYGEPVNSPIPETDRTLPTNPYGETKLAVERMLHWCESAYGIRYAVLRYFNAAGAHPSGKIGEDHSPESHLIPLVLQTALGQRDHITVFGTDYPTPDGTCIRDYIHVCDLANAHILALDHIIAQDKSVTYNLGNGKGFSVNEVIECAKKVTALDISVKHGERRKGDPAILVASSDKIISELKWKPQMNSLEDIINSAWDWHRNNPKGFA